MKKFSGVMVLQSTAARGSPDQKCYQTESVALPCLKTSSGLLQMILVLLDVALGNSHDHSFMTTESELLLLSTFSYKDI